MTNRPCIYFKKTWKQPCYFWKHVHLFRASWRGGTTVESYLWNRESVVPPTALLQGFNCWFQKNPETRIATLVRQSPRPDNHPLQFPSRRCKNAATDQVRANPTCELCSPKHGSPSLCAWILKLIWILETSSTSPLISSSKVQIHSKRYSKGTLDESVVHLFFKYCLFFFHNFTF